MKALLWGPNAAAAAFSSARSSHMGLSWVTWAEWLLVNSSSSASAKPEAGQLQHLHATSFTLRFCTSRIAARCRMQQVMLGLQEPQAPLGCMFS